MAAGGHFGCPKFTFDHISGHFRSIGHFGFPKFTFDRNSAISDRSAILDFQKLTFLGNIINYYHRSSILGSHAIMVSTLPELYICFNGRTRLTFSGTWEKNITRKLSRSS